MDTSTTNFQHLLCKFFAFIGKWKIGKDGWKEGAWCNGWIWNSRPVNLPFKQKKNWSPSPSINKSYGRQAGSQASRQARLNFVGAIFIDYFWSTVNHAWHMKSSCELRLFIIILSSFQRFPIKMGHFHLQFLQQLVTKWIKR